MGQAKKRGTFEQRKAESIQNEAERQAAYNRAMIEKEEARLAYEAANPRNAAARRRRTTSTAVMLAGIMGLSVVNMRRDGHG